jgi:hypothetical protein
LSLFLAWFEWPLNAPGSIEGACATLRIIAIAGFFDAAAGILERLRAMRDFANFDDMCA